MNTTYWLNQVIGEVFPVNGRTFFVGLSSSEPNADGGNITEPSGNGYARAILDSFTAPENGLVTNVADITFPSSTGTWFAHDGRAAHWLLFDGDGANANLLASGEIEMPTAVLSNTVVAIRAGEIRLRLTDGAG